MDARPRPWVQRQDQRRPGRPVEVEVRSQVAEAGLGVAHVRPGIGAAVGCGVQTLAAKEVVLDELVDGIEAERLAIDWILWILAGAEATVVFTGGCPADV